MINAQVLKGNLIRQDYTTAFILSQGDKGVPFKIELLENGAPYILQNTDIVAIEWYKPNGNPFLQDTGITKGDTYIEITTPEAISQSSGSGTFNIIISDGTTRKGTIRREYKVIPTSMRPGSVSEDTITDAITELRNLNTELAETVQNNKEIINSNTAATKSDIASVNSSLEEKASKSETTNLQGQINNLVLGAVGDGNNAEVVQARGNNDVLNDRFENIELNINTLSDKVKEDVEINDINVARTVTATVDETQIGQNYLGGYIEIQPDSWDGENVAIDKTTKAWGFPMSLLSSEQARIKDMILKGNGKNIMFIRLPLGFAYRGLRNVDTTSNLAKNIGERFKGQNKSLKLWFQNISEAGGGLAPEYWCPAQYWVTSGSYSGSYSGSNQLWAGGNNARTVTLASIKSTDLTQYNAQIEAFTDAIVDDLEYLHQNIAPVRMFSLQNEPAYDQMAYGACKYDAQTYNDVLEVLYPKILASEILKEYNDEENKVKLLVASSDETSPFTGVASTFITNHSNMIWGYTHHSMRKASGESYSNGADWYKTDEFTTIKGNKTNVFINEYEYFSTTFGTDKFRCSNNMLHMINEVVYGEAQVLHPVIHVCKPLGQTLSSTNTKGYCLFEANLKGSYGVDITHESNTNNLAKGTVIPNATMYNAWALFGDNLPIGAYLVGDYTNTISKAGWCTFKYGGQLYIFMANSGETDAKITLTFSSNKIFKGKLYTEKYCGFELKDKNGTSIEFTIPAYSGQVWIESIDDYRNKDYIYGYINDDGAITELVNNYIENKYKEVTASKIIINTTISVANIRIAEYNINKQFIQRQYGENSSTGKTTDTFTLSSNTKYVRVGFVVKDLTTVHQLFASYSLKNKVENYMYYEIGGISSTTGLDETAANKIRTDFIAINGTTVHVKTNKTLSTMQHALRYYNSNKEYISSSFGLNVESTYTLPANCSYIKILAVKENSSPVINSKELDGEIVIVGNTEYVLKQK